MTDIKGLKNTIGGKKANRYDVVVEGATFFKPLKSNSPDMDGFHYICLFSPTLEFKAIEIKK